MYYNVAMKRFRVTTAAVEKHSVFHILCARLQPWLSSMQSACAVLYCHLLPVWLYHIFPRYLINDMNFRKMADY